MQISGFRTCYCVILDIAYAVCYNSANINRNCAPSKGRMIEQVGILHGKG